MNKIKLQAKLFLFYLRIKKPLIIFMAVATAIIIGWDNWQKYRYEYAKQNPWKLAVVNSGSSFTVTRHDRTKTINLCGVQASGEESKGYLETLLAQRIGEPVFEESGQGYDAWITLDWENGVKFIRDLPYEVEQSPEINLHLNTWLIEKGLARYDRSSGCNHPENLANAETIAKEGKADDF